MPKKTFLRLKASKQTRVYQGLIDVFYEKGYEAVSVADIVKVCAIPRGSFYMYFEDKFDAFMYILSHAQKDKMIYLKPVLDRLNDRAFMDCYIDLIKAGLAYANEHPKLVGLWMRFYRSSSHRLSQHWRVFELQAIDVLSEYLKQDQNRGHIRDEVDIRSLAKLLYHIQSIDILEAYIDGEAENTIINKVDAYLEIILNGIKEA